MKFTLYLEAVKHCAKAGIPYAQIERHGELWKRYWVVPKRKRSQPTQKITTN